MAPAVEFKSVVIQEMVLKCKTLSPLCPCFVPEKALTMYNNYIIYMCIDMRLNVIKWNCYLFSMKQRYRTRRMFEIIPRVFIYSVLIYK